MVSLWKQVLRLSCLNLTGSSGQRLPSLLKPSWNCEQRTLSPQTGLVSSCHFSTSQANHDRLMDFKPPSPYKQPGPRRYGYSNKMFASGLLPRPHMKKVLHIPQYSPGENWAKKKAMFGQNDYIDILGDGGLHPVDLIKGPGWIIGFKGNELQRLNRRLRFEGRKMKILYPTQYHQMKKRIYFLNKKYNRGRKSHSW